MPGSTISHFQILEKLGEGGMGVVYKAEDTKLGRTVALKFLPHALLAGEAERIRFLHEARASAALHHPNIATVFEIDEDDGAAFIALEYVDGQTVADRLSSGPLPVDETLTIAIQVCEGLREAHERGIVHRDIKSQNIMVTRKNQVKILDFGLAKLRGASPVTRTGTTLGTLGYMSPEQLVGEAVDHRTDIWALGVVLYEMLAARRPFQAEFEAAVTYKVMHEEPEPLSRVRSDLPQHFDRIVGRMLAKRVEDRYQTMDEVLDDLQRVRSGGTPGTGHPTRHRRPIAWKKLRIPGALAAALLAVSLTLLLLPGRKTVEKERKSIAVLPFQNFSDDRQDEYFSDGMTDELISALVKIEGLRVPGRSSVFVFKGRQENVRSISEQLNVATVLEGSVRRAGNRIRITTQLINAEDGFTLWAETYEREMKDIFAVQDDITRRIVEVLKVAFRTGSGPTNRPMTRDLEAYNLFLKGMYHVNKRSAADIRTAIEFFQQAKERDPSFGQAYAGLSEAYVLLAVQAALSPRVAYPKSLAAAYDAVRLDPGSAQAHTCLAHIAFHVGDLTVAAREFEIARNLESHYAPAHQFASELFIHRDQLDSARASIDRALELSPLDLAANAALANILGRQRRWQEALDQLQKTLTLDSNYFLAHLQLGSTYQGSGNTARAEAELRTGVRLTGGNRGLGALGMLYASTGRLNEARAVLKEMSNRFRTTYTSPLEIARLAAALGDKNQALEWLDQVLVDDPWTLRDLEGHPPFDLLANDQRFQALKVHAGQQILMLTPPDSLLVPPSGTGRPG